MDKEQWLAQRSEVWKKAWRDLIDVCSPSTLNGMYVALNGGGNLLGSLVGGGPYNEDATVETPDPEHGVPPTRLTITERAQLMTDLAGATEEGMTFERINQMEAVFHECLNNDEAYTGKVYFVDELTNTIAQYIIEELNESSDNSDADIEDQVAEWCDQSSEHEVAELASDIETRMAADGLPYTVSAFVISQAGSLGDLAMAIAADNPMEEGDD